LKRESAAIARTQTGEPVRAKAEGRDPGLPKPLAHLFPDSFQDSELGEIPEGWRVGLFSNVVEQLRDSVNPLESPEEVFLHFSIPAFDDGQWPKHEVGESIKSLKFRVPPGAVLLSKLNPEIERVWLVDVPPGERAVCSTEFLVLVPRPPHGRSYVYCLARSQSFRQQLESLVTGTSKSHQRAQASAILGLTVLRPPEALLSQFEEAADPLVARILECRRESRTLAALRDALLPKLISGQLRVKDAERFLKERGL
jgi:type I restriction enzyme S subunit